MKTVFGLDFGTSNSALSILTNDRVEVIGLDPFNEGQKTMRSIIFFEENGGIYFGQEAIHKYLENNAHGRLMQSIKTFLPSAVFGATYVYGKKYELEDIIALVLSKIKLTGERYVGHEVNSVVIGRPVIFSDDKQADKLAEARLRRAANLAGFKNVAFQMEPTAAAFAFESGLNIGEERLVLVGDFGGGTSDFTVIRLSGSRKRQQDRSQDVLSTSGIYLAGDAFDSALMWRKVAQYFGRDVQHRNMSGNWLSMPLSVMSKLKAWHLIPQLREKSVREFIRKVRTFADDQQSIRNLEHLIEDNYGFFLFQAIEKAKIDLSTTDKTKILFSERDLHIVESVHRLEFEQIVQDLLRLIGDKIDLAVSQAGVRREDVDLVLTTGGTSYIPCVRDLFAVRFGQEKIQQIDAYTSVAHGLGLSAQTLFS